MDQMQEKLNKLREERLAREKARIEKLRELNLKKYNKNEEPKNAASNQSAANKPVKSESSMKNVHSNTLKNNFHVNGTTKRPISVPEPKNNLNKVNKDTIKSKIGVSTTKNVIKSKNIDMSKKNTYIEKKPISHVSKLDKKPANSFDAQTKVFNNTMPQRQTKPIEKRMTMQPTRIERKPTANTDKKANLVNKRDTTSNLNARKSIAANAIPLRKSIAPKPATNANKSDHTSVFERLYKPKTQEKHIKDVEKLQTDPHYLQKVIHNSGLILNKRHSVFEPMKAKIAAPVRRSISAVHFKRISREELPKCIQKWSSIGDKLNNVHLTHINEDESVKDDRIVSAVKSERKKVTFMTPVPNLNTPRPEELQARLKSWLQKRGKSLDSYHHLQCFGLHHMPKAIKFDPKVFDDDEDKENKPVDSDSDNDSYTENMNDEEQVTRNKWRRVSSVSDSLVDMNDSQNTTITGSDVVNTDDVVLGALNDLAELLKEGFDWEQCARWLRAIRERFPSAPLTAGYWECRAALEESRGNLPASVQCWEEAIVKGTEHSVVEANLDQLLDKFMQLKISPTSGKQRPVDPKLVDVKNVFKSTIIRFAVQQAKLRQSGQFDAPKYTVTPVRRSARLSAHWSGKRTPLQVCTSVRQADELVGQKPVFVPNESLYDTP